MINLSAGSRSFRGSHPTPVAAHQRPSGRSHSTRTDRSTITSPTPSGSRTQISPGIHGATQHRNHHNHSPPPLTPAPVQISESEPTSDRTAGPRKQKQHSQASALIGDRALARLGVAPKTGVPDWCRSRRGSAGRAPARGADRHRASVAPRVRLDRAACSRGQRATAPPRADVGRGVGALRRRHGRSRLSLPWRHAAPLGRRELARATVRLGPIATLRALIPRLREASKTADLQDLRRMGAAGFEPATSRV